MGFTQGSTRSNHRTGDSLAHTERADLAGSAYGGILIKRFAETANNSRGRAIAGTGLALLGLLSQAGASTHARSTRACQCASGAACLPAGSFDKHTTPQLPLDQLIPDFPHIPTISYMDTDVGYLNKD